MLQMLVGGNRPASSEIVWRNPNRGLRAHRRRHSVEPAAGRALYIVQEFVEAGQSGFWLTISGLEVFSGGRAA